jgi:hypothetical protein
VLQSPHAGWAVTSPPRQPLRVFVTPVAALSQNEADITAVCCHCQILDVVNLFDLALNRSLASLPENQRSLQILTDPAIIQANLYFLFSSSPFGYIDYFDRMVCQTSRTFKSVY